MPPKAVVPPPAAVLPPVSVPPRAPVPPKAAVPPPAAGLPPVSPPRAPLPIHKSWVRAFSKELRTGDPIRVSWTFEDDDGIWIGRCTRRGVPGLPTQVTFDREEIGTVTYTMSPCLVEFPSTGITYLEVSRLTNLPHAITASPSADGLDAQDAIANDDDDDDAEEDEDPVPPAPTPPLRATSTNLPTPSPATTTIVAPPSPPSDFLRSGTIPPGVADLKGGSLVTLEVYRSRPPHIPTEAWSGLVNETRAEHRRLLQRVQAMPPELHALPLDLALLHLLRRMAQESPKGWAPSTLHKKHASMQGAMSALPLYTNSPHPIHLARSPTWRSALSSLSKGTKEFAAREPVAASAEELFSVLPKANATTASALALTWVTAARLGCVLQLNAGDITLTPGLSPTDSWRLVANFRRGKGVLFRGPYSVHTLMPPEQAKILRNLQAPLRSDARLFPTPTQTHKAALTALRARNPLLEVRSLRRGALQCLALTTPEELLLNFSGHTNVRTLRRYLGWGRVVGRVAQETTAAARHLQPQHLLPVAPPGHTTILRRPPPPYHTSHTSVVASRTPGPAPAPTL